MVRNTGPVNEYEAQSVIIPFVDIIIRGTKRSSGATTLLGGSKPWFFKHFTSQTFNNQYNQLIASTGLLKCNGHIGRAMAQVVTGLAPWRPGFVPQ
jgi:hypothetical protein